MVKQILLTIIYFFIDIIQWVVSKLRTKESELERAAMEDFFKIPEITIKPEQILFEGRLELYDEIGNVKIDAVKCAMFMKGFASLMLDNYAIKNPENYLTWEMFDHRGRKVSLIAVHVGKGKSPYVIHQELKAKLEELQKEYDSFKDKACLLAEMTRNKNFSKEEIASIANQISPKRHELDSKKVKRGLGDLAPCGEMQAEMIHKMRELNEKQTS
mgnify:CR=1 FL=1